jgi:hypothetical protein
MQAPRATARSQGEPGRNRPTPVGPGGFATGVTRPTLAAQGHRPTLQPNMAMKKRIMLPLVVAGLLVVGGLAAASLLGSVVRKGITTVGPRLTGTPVTLEHVRLSPLSGSGSLTGLTVGNPPGWQSERAFSLGRIHLDLEPLSLLSDAIVIEELSIDGAQFVYETRLVRSNIKDLLDAIEKATGGPAAPGSEGSPQKFIVKKFTLTDSEVSLGVSMAAIRLPLPPITLTDLGVQEGGITASELTGALMRSVLADIGQASAKAAGQLGATGGAVAVEAIGSAAQKAGEGLRKLFGAGDKAAPKEAEPKR